MSDRRGGGADHVRRAAVLVAILGVLAGVLAAVGQMLPLLLERPPERIGTIALVLGGVSFLVSPVAVLLVGYLVGGRVDVPDEWTRVAVTFGVVGAVASFAGALLVSFLVPIQPMRGSGRTVAGASGFNAIVRGVSFAISGVAGAAVAEFSAE